MNFSLDVRVHDYVRVVSRPSLRVLGVREHRRDRQQFEPFDLQRFQFQVLHRTKETCVKHVKKTAHVRNKIYWRYNYIRQYYTIIIMSRTTPT